MREKKVRAGGARCASQCFAVAGVVAAIVVALASASAFAKSGTRLTAPYVDKAGTVHLPEMEIPFSDFASLAAREAFIRERTGGKVTPSLNGDIRSLRQFYQRQIALLVQRDRILYPVNIKKRVLNGVRVEEITPRAGVSRRNRERVLINLHGGGFMWGEGPGGEVDSIPISAIGRIRVITVAYREAPEFRFPAASEDVAAVYRFLLKRYRPKDIGIYGCSAGGILTAESIAWFEKVDLPLPGAIGTLCGSGSVLGGDSAYVAQALVGARPHAIPGLTEGTFSFSPYFKGVSYTDPLVAPIVSRSVLAKFPPTLLIGGSRDFTVSSLYRMQAALTDVNVDAELHVWDGMWHAFFSNPDLPESKQVYQVIVRFFDAHLHQKPQVASLCSTAEGTVRQP